MAAPPAPASQSNPKPISAAARRAASIRRTGKLPLDVRYFDPPEAVLGGALIAGRTPALAALDREFAEASTA
jgi:hypothetical protein